MRICIFNAHLESLGWSSWKTPREESSISNFVFVVGVIPRLFTIAIITFTVRLLHHARRVAHLNSRLLLSRVVVHPEGIPASIELMLCKKMSSLRFYRVKLLLIQSESEKTLHFYFCIFFQTYIINPVA